MGTIVRLDNLAPEILDHIIALTYHADKVALCSVSKLIGCVATRALYRAIYLHCAVEKTILLCRTLVSNASAALAVRVLHLTSPHGWNKALAQWETQGRRIEPLFSAFFRLINNALKCVARTTVLKLVFFERHASTILDGCYLPQLRDAAIGVSNTRTLGAFLRCNDTIESLHIMLGCHLPPANFAGVHLPALTTFDGPSNSVPYILPGSPVRNVTVIWPPFYPNVAPNLFPSSVGYVISSLGQCPAITSVRHVAAGWPKEFVSSVGGTLPNLVALHIINGHRTAVNPFSQADELLIALRQALPTMSNLQEISLYRKKLVNMVADFDVDYSAEYSLLLEWGDLCPTLKVCTLPSGTVWCRIQESPWFPPIIALNPDKEEGYTTWLASAGTKGLSILKEIVEGLTVLRAMHEKGKPACLMEGERSGDIHTSV